jgi:hypothetical protein
METFIRTILGLLAGAFTYAVTWYWFVVLGVYMVSHQLDFKGEWGGMIVLAVIAFVIGGVIGCFIGLLNPKTRNLLAASLYLSTALMILKAVTFFYSPEYPEMVGRQWRLATEVCSWIVFIAMIVFDNWVIKKMFDNWLFRICFPDERALLK